MARGRYHAPLILKCQKTDVFTITTSLCGDFSNEVKTPGILTLTICPSMGREPEVTTGRLRMEYVPMLLGVTLLIQYLVVDMDYLQCYAGLLKRFPVGGHS